MKNYSVTMEFTGHHQINFQAKNNEDAVRMVENGELYDKDKKVLFYQDEIHESEECIPINLIDEKDNKEIWTY